jgi:hypothetical protein
MFTTDNTEGFSHRELAVINQALAILMSHAEGAENADQLEKSYSDLLNNAWHEGTTADALVRAVRK